MTSNIQDLLKQLRTDYLATFPSKIEILEKLWQTSEIDLLKTEYHKLKGTGRTYGITEISQVGEALELLCHAPRKVLDQAVPQSLDLLKRIHKMRQSEQVINLDIDLSFQLILNLIIQYNSSK